jgi:hypothetical protein
MRYGAGALALFYVKEWALPAVAVFLMAAQSAFSAFFNGNPETFNDREISHANGNIEWLLFAVIFGVGAVSS